MLLTIELEGYYLQIDLMDMLVDGANFGMAKDRYCYLPIFKSLQNDNTWYVGSVILNKYVLEFDISIPSIGIGLDETA